jgi:hypothetical protein
LTDNCRTSVQERKTQSMASKPDIKTRKSTIACSHGCGWLPCSGADDSVAPNSAAVRCLVGKCERPRRSPYDTTTCRCIGEGDALADEEPCEDWSWYFLFVVRRLFQPSAIQVLHVYCTSHPPHCRHAATNLDSRTSYYRMRYDFDFPIKEAQTRMMAEAPKFGSDETLSASTCAQSSPCSDLELRRWITGGVYCETTIMLRTRYKLRSA